MIGSRRRRLRRHHAARLEGTHSRPIWLPILIGAAVLGAVLAVILGNVLGKQTEGLGVSGSDIRRTYGSIPVPVLCADAFELGYAIEGMKTNGTTAVTVPLRSQADQLTYVSETAVHMGRQKDNSTLASVSTEIQYLHQNEIYVCGVFYAVSAGMSGQARTAEEYYERSLVAELADAGLDELLINGLSFADENAEASLTYLASLRSSAPDLAIGAILTPEQLRGNGAETMLRTYLRSADFFVMDLRGVTDTAHLTAILKDAAYCLRAFPIRLLLDRADEQTRTWLEQNDYHELQILPDTIE